MRSMPWTWTKHNGTLRYMPQPESPEPIVCHAYRDADPFCGHLHLPAVRRRQSFLDQESKEARELMNIAMEADAAAAEACLCLEHDRLTTGLSPQQRDALRECTYALNRLVLEIQCEMNRIPPIGPSARLPLVTYMVLWRSFGPQCFDALNLPVTLRVPGAPARLRAWQPKEGSLQGLCKRLGW